jgi:hypothetical protein
MLFHKKQTNSRVGINISVIRASGSLFTDGKDYLVGDGSFPSMLNKNNRVLAEKPSYQLTFLEQSQSMSSMEIRCARLFEFVASGEWNQYDWNETFEQTGLPAAWPEQGFPTLNSPTHASLHDWDFQDKNMLSHPYPKRHCSLFIVPRHRL